MIYCVWRNEFRTDLLLAFVDGHKLVQCVDTAFCRRCCDVSRKCVVSLSYFRFALRLGQRYQNIQYRSDRIFSYLLIVQKKVFKSFEDNVIFSVLHCLRRNSYVGREMLASPVNMIVNQIIINEPVDNNGTVIEQSLNHFCNAWHL